MFCGFVIVHFFNKDAVFLRVEWHVSTISKIHNLILLFKTFLTSSSSTLCLTIYSFNGIIWQFTPNIIQCSPEIIVFMKMLSSPSSSSHYCHHRHHHNHHNQHHYRHHRRYIECFAVVVAFVHFKSIDTIWNKESSFVELSSMLALDGLLVV